MDVEITELEKIDAERVDGVRAPASGIPILLMKSLPEPAAKAGGRDCPKCGKGHDADHKGNTCESCGADLPAADDAAKALPDWHADAVALVKKAMVRGKVDESADIDGGQQAIALVGKLIGYEAQELAAGNLGEVADIGLLADAAALLRQWVSGESAVQDGNVMPATALMQSAAKTEDWTPERWAEWAAAIPGARLLPPGDTGDTSKSQIAPEETTVDTVTQTGDLTEVVKAAVAKATEPLEKLRKELEEAVAKVKATPVPGGPVLSRNVQVKQPGAVVNEDYAAKAAYYREQADLWSSQDRATADGYRLKAREADAKAVTPAS